MKQLLICRHAKSSWKDASLADIDRPLNKRGKRDAPRMGTMLAHNGIQPDLIVSSPAKRARKTAKILAEKLKYPKKHIACMDAIYEASPGTLLECIHSFEDRFNQVAVVGHNPGFTLLANMLGDLKIANVPTCGVVALNFNADRWRDVRKKEGDLLFYFYPKM